MFWNVGWWILTKSYLSFFRFNSKDIIWILLAISNLVSSNVVSLLTDYWHPFLEAYENQVLRIATSRAKLPVVFPKYKECLRGLQLIHKDFQTCSIKNLCLSKKKLYYLQFFDFKSCIHYIFASLFFKSKESNCETWKNVFCFTSKALFFLWENQIFEF